MSVAARSDRAAGPVEAPSRRGRAWRLAIVAVLFGAVLAGSIWGDDINFPFGPFRMYASTEPVDGTVSTYVLRGRPAGEPETDLASSDFGVRPAELEGRLGQLSDDCHLLNDLMTAFERRHPTKPPLVELSLVRRVQPLRDGQTSGPSRDETVARSCG